MKKFGDNQKRENCQCCCIDEDNIFCKEISNLKGNSEFVKKEILVPSSTPLIDSHCHLQLSPLFEQSSDIVNTSKQMGIKRVVVCGVCPGDDWNKVLNLFETFPDFIVPSLGLHPNYVANFFELNNISSDIISSIKNDDFPSEVVCLLDKLVFDLTEALTRSPRVHVGEIGLDKGARERAGASLQLEVARRQMSISKLLGRTASVHCAGCWGAVSSLAREFTATTQQQRQQQQVKKASKGAKKIQEIMSEEGRENDEERNSFAIVLHCVNFMPAEVLRELLSHSRIFFSFTVRERCLRETERAVLRAVPLDRLLLETDSPSFSSFSSLSSIFSSPVLLAHSIDNVAAIKNISSEELSSATYDNAVKAFNLI